MERGRDTIGARARRALRARASPPSPLAIVMTWPLASGLDRLGRTANSGDARVSVWNVAWVAHALLTDPADLFDANIFHPHKNTLAFSEANLVAGVVALPAWWLTRQRRHRAQRGRAVLVRGVGRHDVADSRAG